MNTKIDDIDEIDVNVNAVVNKVNEEVVGGVNDEVVKCLNVKVAILMMSMRMVKSLILTFSNLFFPFLSHLTVSGCYVQVEHFPLLQESNLKVEYSIYIVTVNPILFKQLMFARLFLT